MATIAAPPRRPPRSIQTRRGGKVYWTIHTHPNNAFSVRVNENSKTALVGFKNVDHAILIGKMIETYYMTQQEWPSTDGQLILPAPHDGDLNFLSLRKWDFAELKVECTKNFLSMVAIDNLETTKRGFNFDGKILSFEAPNEFYTERLEEILRLEGM
jgi:hypothetical protein